MQERVGRVRDSQIGGNKKIQKSMRKEDYLTIGETEVGVSFKWEIKTHYKLCVYSIL